MNNPDSATNIIPAPPVDFAGWLQQAWELFKSDWLKFSVSLLLCCLIGSVTCGILMAPMLVGLYRAILNKTQGIDYTYGDLFYGVKNQFLASLVLMLVVIGGSAVIAIIPIVGWLVYPILPALIAPLMVFTLFELATAPQTIPVGDLVGIVKRQWERLQSQYIMYVLWFLLVQIIGMVGFIACCIGIFASTAFGACAIAVSYVAATKGVTAKA